MLKQRLLTVAVVLPGFMLALFAASTWVWGLFIGAVALIGAVEWSRLSAMSNFGRAFFLASVAAAIGLAWWLESASAGGLYSTAQGKIALLAVALFWGLSVPVWLVRHQRMDTPWVLGLAGFLALVPLWHAMYAYHDSPWRLLGMMSVVWLADTAAYAAGRLFGRRKLAPRISPGKTWEGVAGAAIAVPVYVLGMATVFPGEFADPLPMVAIGVMMLLLSIEGDLLESWLKRMAGVKDSGKLLPGHGGVLDRIDALTGALPLGLFALWWFSQPA